MVKFYLKENAEWELMKLLGYTRDSSKNTSFYVKKFSKSGKTKIYIDLVSFSKNKGLITWSDKSRKEPVYPFIQDLFNYGLAFVDVGGKVVDFIEYLEYREFDYEAMDFYVLSLNKKYVKVNPQFFTDINIGDYYVANTEYEGMNPKKEDSGLTKVYLNRKF